MGRILELSKKAGVAGVILMSLPVLVPCLMVIVFTGALLVLPVGSAAVGFIACKKLAASSQVRRLRSSSGGCYEQKQQQQQQQHPDHEASVCAPQGEENHAMADEEELLQAEGLSAEEAPEKGPGFSDDFIVVEKPHSDSTSVRQEQEEQCKTAPEHFQCVEAEEAKVPPAAAAADGNEEPKHDNVPKVDEDEKPFVEVGDHHEAEEEKAEEKPEGVGLSVILDDSKKNQEPHVKKVAEQQQKEPVQENGTSAAAGVEEPPRSSVDEYVSLAEDFPSSDESVASSCSKSGTASTDKEKRARLRKELTLVKRVVGCKDSAGGSLSEQVERLYGFLGVELPSSYHHTSDYDKLLEAMNVLKAVVGVK